MEESSKNSFLGPFLIVLSALGLFLLGRKLWLWNKCQNGCPEPGMLKPCVPKKCNFWSGKPVEEEKKSPRTCREQHQDATNEFTKSGQACILTSERWVCPTDSGYQADVNPCVGNILKGKGWTPVNTNAPNNNPPAQVQFDLEVSNPNGAYMYYQSLSQASGGMIYGKSNVLVPFGTKLKMVKFWQTSLSTQPYGGFYETTYRPYVNQNGFFDYNDIKKI